MLEEGHVQRLEGATSRQHQLAMRTREFWDRSCMANSTTSSRCTMHIYVFTRRKGYPDQRARSPPQPCNTCTVHAIKTPLGLPRMLSNTYAGRGRLRASDIRKSLIREDSWVILTPVSWSRYVMSND